MKPLDRKPRAGDRLGFGEFDYTSNVVVPPTASSATVVRIDGVNPAICWAKYDGHGREDCFIWQFRDQLNRLAFLEEG